MDGEHLLAADQRAVRANGDRRPERVRRAAAAHSRVMSALDDMKRRLHDRSEHYLMQASVKKPAPACRHRGAVPLAPTECCGGGCSCPLSARALGGEGARDASAADDGVRVTPPAAGPRALASAAGRTSALKEAGTRARRRIDSRLCRSCRSTKSTSGRASGGISPPQPAAVRPSAFRRVAHEPGALGEERRLGAGAQVELSQDVADVRARRALADRQLERDLLVGTGPGPRARGSRTRGR